MCVRTALNYSHRLSRPRTLVRNVCFPRRVITCYQLLIVLAVCTPLSQSEKRRRTQQEEKEKKMAYVCPCRCSLFDAMHSYKIHFACTYQCCWIDANGFVDRPSGIGCNSDSEKISLHRGKLRSRESLQIPTNDRAPRLPLVIQKRICSRA